MESERVSMEIARTKILKPSIPPIEPPQTSRCGDLRELFGTDFTKAANLESIVLLRLS
jgi:hypothetical protein